MENPYTVLELKPNASKKDITKAYRDLAKIWHPDKNKSPEAEEKFKKINDAYNYLMDDTKKDFLDTHGRRMDEEDEAQHSHPGAGQGFPFGPGFPFAQAGFHFAQGGGFPFGQGGSFPFGQGGFPFAVPTGPNPEQIKEMKRKQLHIKMNIEMTLGQIYTGINKKLKYPRVRVVSGVQKQEEGEVELDIKPGFTSSSHIEIKNKGHIFVEDDGSEIVGSVIFVVSEAADQVYERDYKKQENLICKKKISLVEALCGFSMELPHPSGSTIAFETQLMVKQTSQYKIVNKGLPVFGNSKSFGDIIFKFEIEYPKVITMEQRVKLEEIFNYKQKEIEQTPNKIIGTLHEYQEEEAEESDDQNGAHGGQSVQCAQS
ncbi:MAG: J domain-containing protein [Spirochaetia bacterium]|jgi:DnaJ-class molecular chaperone|nr:J domain-containing protein [Spirochaetia bacterium]